MNEQMIDASRTALDTQLEVWFLSLPSSLTNPYRRSQDFWCTQIHLHYNLALLQLYRTTHLASRSVTPRVSISLKHSSKSIEICHNAATSISQLFGSLLTSRKIDQCCFTALPLLLASAIQISLEARLASSSSSAILTLQAHSRLEDLFPIMEEVAKYWPSVEAIHCLFRDVLGEMKLDFERNQAAESLQTVRDSGAMMQQPVQHHRTNFEGAHGPFIENQIGLSDGNWNALLSTWDTSILFDDI
jgi:transcriptional regulatory protein AMDR